MNETIYYTSVPAAPMARVALTGGGGPVAIFPGDAGDGAGAADAPLHTSPDVAVDAANAGPGRRRARLAARRQSRKDRSKSQIEPTQGTLRLSLP